MSKVGKRGLEIMRNASWYNSWIFSFISPYISGDILEIGGGIGNFTPLLLNNGSVVSIDIKKEYLPKIKKTTRGRAKVGIGDIEKGKYFFGQKKFDTAICLNVLEHINGHKNALKNMYKLLKKDGHLCLLVPTHQFFFGKMDKNLGHYRRYSKNNLKTLVRKAGFEVIMTKYLNPVGGLGWFINSRILKRETVSSKQVRLFDWLARPFLLLEKYYDPPFGLSVLIIARK